MTINLLPWRELERKRLRKKIALDFGKILMLIFFAVMMWSFLLKYKIRSIENENNKLAAFYADDYIMVLFRQQLAFFKKIHLVNQFLPKDLCLIKMVQKNNQLRVVGYSENSLALHQFKEKLKKLALKKILLTNQNNKKFELIVE